MEGETPKGPEGGFCKKGETKTISIIKNREQESGGEGGTVALGRGAGGFFFFPVETGSWRQMSGGVDGREQRALVSTLRLLLGVQTYSREVSVSVHRAGWSRGFAQECS